MARGFSIFPNDNFDKGDFRFKTKISYHSGGSYFSSNKGGLLDLLGKKTSSLPNNTQEKYQDVLASFELQYGFTQNTSLYLLIPFGYRTENRSINAEQFGLSDIHSGFSWRFFDRAEHDIKLLVDIKFPTGTTQIGFSDPTQNISPKLPLGDGSTDFSGGLQFTQNLLNTLSIEESLTYTIRFKTLAEYLDSGSFTFFDSNGNSYNLPIGNLEIDWGDELRGHIGFRFKFLNHFFLRVRGSYFWRDHTRVEFFDYNTSGNITTSAKTMLNLGRSHYVSTILALEALLSKHWSVEVGWSHPLMGKNYPLPSLSFVESLLGETYHLEMTYAF
ncbi:MAG: hypothetical protein KDD48_07355 [Bdellovibrionales bacterium]|nr:hypothetical protein [Bdellovibrionales bacterium]